MWRMTWRRSKRVRVYSPLPYRTGRRCDANSSCADIPIESGIGHTPSTTSLRTCVGSRFELSELPLSQEANQEFPRHVASFSPLGLLGCRVPPRPALHVGMQ